ncbi:MAG: MFS transporter [Salinarimonas sp.]|nr:MFS transporter [Salinarimonas sp.]
MEAPVPPEIKVARGWRGVLHDVPGLPFIMVTVALHMMMFGMLTPVMALYAQGFGIGEWQIGLMITVFAIGRLAADIPAGHAAPRIGLAPLLWGGPLLCGIGSVIGAIGPDYVTVLAGRMLQGVGSGIYMTAATIFCARSSSPINRGRVMALFQGALLSGAAAGPALGGFSAGLLGLAGPFWVSGAIGLVTACYAFFAFGRSDEADAPRPVRHGLRGSTALMLMLPFLCVLLVNFAIFLTRTAAQWQMIPLMAADRFAMQADAIGLALTLSALTNLAVLPLAGILVDTVPRGRIIVVSLLAAAAALVLIVLADSALGFYLGMIGMGAATGLGGPAVAAHAVDVVSEDAIGPAMGMLRFAGDLGYLIGPLSLGLLVDLALVGHGGAILINAALLAACSVIFAVFARAPRAGLPLQSRKGEGHE